MNARKFLINLLVALFLCSITYLTVRECTRYKVVGEVVSNDTVVEVDGRGYDEDNRITICRMDGKCVMYANSDDLLCLKRNSDQIKDTLKNGQLVEITVNGFGNIISAREVTRNEKPKKEEPPKPVETNSVESVK